MDEPNLIDCDQTDLEWNALACEMCRRWCSLHSKLTICRNDLIESWSRWNKNKCHLRSTASIRQHNSPQLKVWTNGCFMFCRFRLTNKSFSKPSIWFDLKCSFILMALMQACNSCTSVRNANLMPTKSISELKKTKRENGFHPRSHCFLLSGAFRRECVLQCNAHRARAICDRFWCSDSTRSSSYNLKITKTQAIENHFYCISSNIFINIYVDVRIVEWQNDPIKWWDKNVNFGVKRELIEEENGVQR